MTLTPQTKLTIPIVTLILMNIGLISAVWHAAGAANQLNARIAELKARLDTSERENYTLARAAEVALRNAILNPGVRFADPRDPTRYVEVSGARSSGATRETP